MKLRKRLKRIMRNPPLHFQVAGIRFVERSNGRCILGDDMGLGKTYQAIAWLRMHPEARPAVIVCPATLKWQWKDELRMHAGLSSAVLSGRGGVVPDKKIIIINYDILSFWQEELSKMKIQVLVLDECHYIKTRQAARTKTCKDLSKNIPHVIALSGTPITGCPVEFFPVLQIINKKHFSSFWRYAFRYCDPKPGWRGKGWDFRGSSNLPELKTKIKPFIIRRLKKNVLKDLPQKRRSLIQVEIYNRIEYEQALNDFLGWVKKRQGEMKARKAMRAEALVKLNQLRGLIANGKIPSAITWINDWMESTKKKLVVFGVHTKVLKALKRKFPSAAMIIGETKNRKGEIKKFQTSKKCRLFIGNIKAAGIGTTLTAASDVLFVEFGWTPGANIQAEDRVLRIGQKSKTMMAYYLIGHDTIEPKLWRLVQSKKRVLDFLLD